MLPSIPVGYAAHMNEIYENMKQLLQSINYEQYCWQLCGDFKVIALGYYWDFSLFIQSIVVFV